MDKQGFIDALRNALSSLPEEDIEERLAFYGEMIDDRMEEGISEEEAVEGIGNIDDIAAQIIADKPLAEPTKEQKTEKRKFKTWEVVLLALGAPIWLSLGVAAVAVVVALYASLWAVVVTLWAMFASLAACFVGGVLACAVFTVRGFVSSGLAMLAAGIVCAGLAIFMFYGCKAATDGTLTLTKKTAIWLKNRFERKETV